MVDHRVYEESIFEDVYQNVFQWVIVPIELFMVFPQNFFHKIFVFWTNN